MTTRFIQAVIAIQEYVVRGDGPIAVGEARPMEYMDGGYIMYPLTFCALVVLFLSARAAWRIWGAGAGTPGAIRAQVDGILFWGSYAVVVGVLGTVVGIAVSAQAVEAVGEVHTQLLWGGIKVALIPTIFGLLYFLGAALIWFGLRYVLRKRMRNRAAA